MSESDAALTLDDLRAACCEAAGVPVAVCLAPLGSGETWLIEVAGRFRRVRRVCDVARLAAVAVELARELKAHPVSPPVASLDGLASDGWWHRHGEAARRAARVWVRVLLENPHMSEAHADRFMASLDEPKLDELVRRADAGVSVIGF